MKNIKKSLPAKSKNSALSKKTPLDTLDLIPGDEASALVEQLGKIVAPNEAVTLAEMTSAGVDTPAAVVTPGVVASTTVLEPVVPIVAAAGVSPLAIAGGALAVGALAGGGGGGGGSSPLPPLAQPTIALVTDSGNATDKISNNAALKISEAAAGVTRVTTVNGVKVTAYDPASLKDGSYKVVVTDTDSGGNTKTASIDFTLDKTIATPVVALANDTGTSATDKITNDPTLKSFGVLASDTTRTITVDGTVVTTYDPTALKDGSHTVVVKDTDTAGNSSSSSLTFTLDRQISALTVALDNFDVSKPTDLSVSNPLPFLSVPDTDVTRQYSVKDVKTVGSVQPSTSFDFSKLVSGQPDTPATYEIKVVDTDVAGNSSSKTLKLDKTASSIQFDESQKHGASTGSIKVVDGSNETLIGNYYVTNAVSSNVTEVVNPAVQMVPTGASGPGLAQMGTLGATGPGSLPKIAITTPKQIYLLSSADVAVTVKANASVMVHGSDAYVTTSSPSTSFSFNDLSVNSIFQSINSENPAFRLQASLVRSISSADDVVVTLDGSGLNRVSVEAAAHTVNIVDSVSSSSNSVSALVFGALEAKNIVNSNGKSALLTAEVLAANSISVGLNDVKSSISLQGVSTTVTGNVAGSLQSFLLLGGIHTESQYAQNNDRTTTLTSTQTLAAAKSVDLSAGQNISVDRVSAVDAKISSAQGSAYASVNGGQLTMSEVVEGTVNTITYQPVYDSEGFVSSYQPIQGSESYFPSRVTNQSTTAANSVKVTSAQDASVEASAATIDVKATNGDANARVDGGRTSDSSTTTKASTVNVSAVNVPEDSVYYGEYVDTQAQFTVTNQSENSVVKASDSVQIQAGNNGYIDGSAKSIKAIATNVYIGDDSSAYVNGVQEGNSFSHQGVDGGYEAHASFVLNSADSNASTTSTELSVKAVTSVLIPAGTDKTPATSTAVIKGSVSDVNVTVTQSAKLYIDGGYNAKAIALNSDASSSYSSTETYAATNNVRVIAQTPSGVEPSGTAYINGSVKSVIVSADAAYIGGDSNSPGQVVEGPGLSQGINGGYTVTRQNASVSGKQTSSSDVTVNAVDSLTIPAGKTGVVEATNYASVRGSISNVDVNTTGDSELYIDGGVHQTSMSTSTGSDFGTYSNNNSSTTFAADEVNATSGGAVSLGYGIGKVSVAASSLSAQQGVILGGGIPDFGYGSAHVKTVTIKAGASANVSVVGTESQMSSEKRTNYSVDDSTTATSYFYQESSETGAAESISVASASNALITGSADMLNASVINGHSSVSINGGVQSSNINAYSGSDKVSAIYQPDQDHTFIYTKLGISESTQLAASFAKISAGGEGSVSVNGSYKELVVSGSQVDIGTGDVFGGPVYFIGPIGSGINGGTHYSSVNQQNSVNGKFFNSQEVTVDAVSHLTIPAGDDSTVTTDSANIQGSVSNLDVTTTHDVYLNVNGGYHYSYENTGVSTSDSNYEGNLSYISDSTYSSKTFAANQVTINAVEGDVSGSLSAKSAVITAASLGYGDDLTIDGGYSFSFDSEGNRTFSGSIDLKALGSNNSSLEVYALNGSIKTTDGNDSVAVHDLFGSVQSLFIDLGGNTKGGNDTVKFDGNVDDYTFKFTKSGGQDVVTVTAKADLDVYTLANVELAVFADDTVRLMNQQPAV